MASSRSSCTPSDSPALGASATAGTAGVAGSMQSSRLSRASLCMKRMGAGGTAAAGEAWRAG
eukprot:scaffold137487_cov136-Phaeocystis_antarctica.AAC.1